MSYAIVWTENDGLRLTGRLDLTAAGVVLTGIRAGASAPRELSYSDLTTARLERSTHVEFPSEPALALGTQAGDRLVIGSLEGVGALHELADELAWARERTRKLDPPLPGRSRTMTGRMLPPTPVRK
jgi:hypothetical protein